MRLVSATTLCLLLAASIRENYSEFGKLIRKIKTELDPFTLYLIGVGDEYLSAISNKDFTIPVAVFTYFQSDLNQLQAIEENIILVVQVDGNPNHYHVIEKFVQHLNTRMSVIIIADSHEIFKDFCLFFTDKKFTRIFGIVNGIDFGYLQYADRPVRRLTDDGPLPDGLKDLNGFNFRTTVQTDYPRTFWYQSRNGQKKIGGYVGRLFVSFVNKHNATFTDIVIGNPFELFIPAVITATRNGNIDISMNAYSNLSEVAMSYPIRFRKWTLLVPINGRINPHEYFLKPFALTVWIYICFTLVYIIFAHIFKDFYTNQPIRLWTYFSETLLLLLGMPTGTSLIGGRRIHIQVILLSHILVNFYCNLLTSFLTVHIQIQQWNTIPDLIEHNVSIMIPHHKWKYIFDKELPYKDIVQIIKPVDSSVHIRERNSMRNQNFAYTMSMDRAEFFLNLQKKNSRPLFHTIRDSLYDLHLGFIMDRHSPFSEILKICILQTGEAGLMHKWSSDELWQGAMADLLTMPLPPEDLPMPLNVHHLHFAWNCLGIGLMLATVVFLCEQYHIVFGKRW